MTAEGKLIDRVKTMRKAQRRYEDTRGWNDLQKAKALEREVDDMLKSIRPEPDGDPMVRDQLLLDI